VDLPAPTRAITPAPILVIAPANTHVNTPVKDVLP
jgi:hypothetical protein